MQCPKCKQNIPEDSLFCQCCGVNIKEWQIANNICPSCGNELPKDSVFCQYCGAKMEAVLQHKQVGSEKIRERFNISKIGAFVFVAVLITLLALNIFQVIKYQNATTELDERVEELKDTNVDLKSKIAHYRVDINDMKSILYFYERHIVFVADDNSQVYHSNPYCEAFDSSSFWAYNTEAAEDMGYTPCHACCNDGIISFDEWKEEYLK